MSNWKTDRESIRDLSPRLEAAWRLALFADDATFAEMPDGTAAQKSGVDRTMSTGDRLEEKVRLRPYSGDILFEIIHTKPEDGRLKKWPGWACAPQASDYMMHAFPLSGLAIVYPTAPVLRWISDLRVSQRFRQISSSVNNPGYTTYSCIVPTSEVPFAREVKL